MALLFDVGPANNTRGFRSADGPRPQSAHLCLSPTAMAMIVYYEYLTVSSLAVSAVLQTADTAYHCRTVLRITSAYLSSGFLLLVV